MWVIYFGVLLSKNLAVYPTILPLYVNGIVTLNSFSPVGIDNPLGELTISAVPTTSLISSTYNKIVTLDPYDPASIVVNMIAKT